MLNLESVRSAKKPHVAMGEEMEAETDPSSILTPMSETALLYLDMAP